MKTAICMAMAAVLLLPAAAGADITGRLALAFMEPHNNEASLTSDGNWGFSGDFEFHLTGTPSDLSWAAGLDYFNLLTERAVFTTPLGFDEIYETTQDQYRIWFGPRLRIHQGGVRPYGDIHLALIYNDIEVSQVVPLFPAGETLVPLDRDWDLSFGYGFTAGVEFRVDPEWSLDTGIRFSGSFGQPQQLSYGAEELTPSYTVYYFGVRWILEEGY